MKDFLLDTVTGDLAFENGDLKAGNSDKQHQRLLLVCDKGNYKEFPATGVGAFNYLESEDAADFLREVRTQFKADGMTINKLAFEDGKLKVDANY